MAIFASYLLKGITFRKVNCRVNAPCVPDDNIILMQAYTQNKILKTKYNLYILKINHNRIIFHAELSIKNKQFYVN